MTSLYELDAQLRNIDALLTTNQDPDTLEILAAAREELEPEIETKMTHILTFIGDLTGKINQLDTETKRIQKRMAALKAKRDFMQKLTKDHMIRTGRTTAEYGSYNLVVAKTPPKVVIHEDEMQWVPMDLCRVKTEPDKTAIKNAMIGDKLVIHADGREIVLAHMESDLTVRIS